jgi:predicted transcriptional regulator
MTLEEIRRQLSLEVRTAGELDTEVTGGYAADLLSCVIAKAQAGNVLVTLQSHSNIVAVASLLDLAGIIITEGMTPDAATIEKAEEKDIPILTTQLTTYTVVGRLFELGVPGVDDINA